MCHQTVSLVSRHLEANGIPTAVIGSARDIVEECGVARFLFSDFPLGNPCGKPYDVEMQRAIVGMALDLVESARLPRTTVQTPFRWSDDETLEAELRARRRRARRGAAPRRRATPREAGREEVQHLTEAKSRHRGEPCRSSISLMSERAPSAATDPLANEAAPRTRFVGREQERGLLSAELGAALAGEGRLVALVGEAGIGKTRTATALAAEARERGAAVAWGRCHERDRAPVYWPVVQALSSLVDGTTGGAREQLASALAGLRVLDAARAAELPPARARFELFERVATALCAAARGRPLVLAFDDLHWADVGSLRMLEFLAREVGSVPLLVLCTLRDDALRSPVEGSAALAALVRLGRSIKLAGLARARRRGAARREARLRAASGRGRARARGHRGQPVPGDRARRAVRGAR